jgi:hypothetical protein
MRMIVIGPVMVLALSTTPVLAGPNGYLYLFNNMINPADGSAGAVDFSNICAPVTVVFNGFLGRLSFSLYAELRGATVGGTAGVECYIEGLETGLPAGWTVATFLASGTTHVGDLVRPHASGTDTFRRDTITWSVTSPEDPNCQGGVHSGNPRGLVFVARVDLTSPFGQGTTFTQQNYHVRVVRPDPPTNPNLLSPFLLQCNSPIYTPVCVTGGAFHHHPDPSDPARRSAEGGCSSTTLEEEQ